MEVIMVMEKIYVGNFCGEREKKEGEVFEDVSFYLSFYSKGNAINVVPL